MAISLFKKKEKPIISTSKEEVKFSHQLMLGISTYAKTAPQPFPIINQSDSGKLTSGHSCEICGASLTKDMIRPLHIKDDKFAVACGLCFYTQNLDLIPHFDRGDIIYFPSMSQTQFNCLLRAAWSIDTFSKAGLSPKQFNEFKHSMTDLLDKINGQLHGMAYYFDSTSVDVLVATLDLLKPDEYHQRHKLLTNFRWLPKREIFKNEIAYWAQHDFSQLHPLKIDDNIEKFMLKYNQEKE